MPMGDDIYRYEGLRHWGPVSEAKVERLLDLIPLPSGSRVLDVGCGRGELLLRLAERYEVKGLGIDSSQAALALLEHDAAERLAAGPGSIESREVAAADFEAEAPYDLVACIGGPTIGEGAASTVKALAQWVGDGGYLLWGQPFWASEPPPQYLEATGLNHRDLASHWDNLTLARAAGLRELYCCVANRDEWDHFEGTLLCNVERYAAAHPDDPEVAERLDKRRHFFDAQQRWGRDALGFGLYLFQR